MLSVGQAAELLGVSDVRVRALLASGQLEGEKIGRAWVIRESSVKRRLRTGARPGRPSKASPGFTRACTDIDEAPRIYDDARRVLTGCYNAKFLDAARDEQEQAFWISVSDFFLQQRQRELIDEGVF